MSFEPRTRAYVERRLAEGKSKPEIMRCLKRYIAHRNQQQPLDIHIASILRAPAVVLRAGREVK